MDSETRYINQVASLGSDLGNLSALDKLVSNARIIMLGEQNHGDGASFIFKTKIVEYLHNYHGYNVLAFEADFYALELAWQRVHAARDVSEHVRHQIYSFWANTEEVAPLWRFIEMQFDGDTPLIVAGIDPRHSGRNSKAEVLKDIKTFLDAQSKDIDGATDFYELLTKMVVREYDHKINALEQEAFFATLKILERRAREFQAATLRNIGFCARNAWSFHGRDEGMVVNLEYLIRERFPQEKVIVWAHNYHIAKKSSFVMDNAYSTVGGYGETLLGEGAAARLDGVVSLALLSAEGWYHAQANFQQRETFTAPPGTLEAELAAQGFDYAFLKLNSADAQSFTMSPVLHNNFKTKPWAEAFDGILFQRRMTGLTF